MTVIAESAPGWTAQEILAGTHDAAAIPVLAPVPNLGYPRQAVWVRLQLRNDGHLPVERLLVLWRGRANRQSTFLQAVPANGEPAAIATSDARELVTRHSVVRIQIPAHSTLRIASRIETATALALDFRILDSEELASIDRIDFASFGLLSGVICAIALYVLAMFLALRERLYLLFASFCLCNFIYQVHIEGYAHIAWPATLGWWGNMTGTYTGAGFVILIVLFVRDYLSLPETQPRAHRFAVKPLIGLMLLVYPLFPLIGWLANTLAAFGTILTTVVLSAIVLNAAIRGHLRTRSFELGILLFFLSGMLHLLKRAGVVPDVQELSLVLQLGSATTVLAFAIAVMQRIRRMADERRAEQLVYANRLESQVAERTAELRHAKDAAEQALAKLQAAQDQLVESEKMASLGQLVAGVAHEVNTPLGIALTASSYLRERTHEVSVHFNDGKLSKNVLNEYFDGAEQSSALIERNLDRAAHLIASFKQVSVDRTSDGRRSFWLHAYLREVVASMEPSWKRRPVTLSIECAEDIELDSFPGALAQVITNLVQNALLHAFGPDDPGHMKIRVEAITPDRVSIEFSDNGRGIDQESLRRVFEPFYTTRRNQGGTGLGLHITWNLVVQKLGGTIRVSSVPGHGMTAHLSIPRIAPASQSRVA